MAAPSLTDLVKQGGQLFQQPSQPAAPQGQPTLAQLASQASQPATPTQPVAAATLGATPNQAAASATPNGQRAQANALQTRVAPQKTLATTLREAQTQSVSDAGTAAGNTLAAQLGNVGSFAQQAAAAAVKAGQAAAMQAAGAGLSADPAKIPAGVDPGAWNSAITTLGNSSSAQADKDQALAEINQLAGRTTGTEYTADQVATLFANTGDTAAATAAQLAGASPDKVTLSMLHPQDLGVGSWQDLGQMLGVSADAVSKMSVADLAAAVKAVQNKGYTTEAQWLGVLTDPSSSMQERSTARSMLAGMGASGITQAEATVQKVSQQAAAANTVTFNGQSVTIDSIFQKDASGQSPVLAGVVKNILSEGAGGPTAAANPDLAKWAIAHAGELQTALAALPSSVTDLANVAMQNMQPYAGFSNPKGMAQAFGFNPDQVTATAWNQPPIAAALAQIASSPSARDGFEKTVGDMKDNGFNPKALSEASYTDLVNAGLVGNNPDLYQAKLSAMQQSSAISAIVSTPQASPDTITQDLLGQSAASTVTSVAVADAASRLGVDTGLPSSLGNLGGNAVLLSGHLAQLAKDAGPPDLLGEKVQPSLKTQLASASDAAAQAAANDPVLGGLLSGIKAGGGRLTVAAVSSQAGGMNDFASLDKLSSYVTKLGNLTDAEGAGQAVQGAISRLVTSQAGALIAAVQVLGVRDVGGLQALVSTPGSAINPNRRAQLQTALAQLQAVPNVDPRVQAVFSNLVATWNGTMQAADEAALRAGGGPSNQQAGDPEGILPGALYRAGNTASDRAGTATGFIKQSAGGLASAVKGGLRR